jgi:hypothetical protein
MRLARVVESERDGPPKKREIEMTRMTRMTIQQAQAQYVHRFTMEHVPAWAGKASDNGKFYAPQYRSDQEWFENTLFPPDNPLGRGEKSCYSRNQTWPLGLWLEQPFLG